jgi:hypothetical protein
VPCPQEPTAGHHPKTHFILAYPHIYAYVSQMVSPFVFSNHPRVWFYVTIDKYFTGLKGTLVWRHSSRNYSTARDSHTQNTAIRF